MILAAPRPRPDPALAHIASALLHGAVLVALLAPPGRPGPAPSGAVAAVVLAVQAGAAGEDSPAGGSDAPLPHAAPPEASVPVAAETAEAVPPEPHAAPAPADAAGQAPDDLPLLLAEAEEPLPLPLPAPPQPPIRPAVARPAAMPAPGAAEARAAPPDAGAGARPTGGASGAAQGVPDRGEEGGSGPAPARATGQAPSLVLVTNPRYRRPPRPAEYPPRAVEDGLTGSVTLHALVSPQGETRTTRVHRSSGSDLLDRAALAAVKEWEFHPAEVEGRRVPAWVEVQVHFHLR